MKRIVAEVNQHLRDLTPRGENRELGTHGDRKLQSKSWETGTTLSKYWCVCLRVKSGQDTLLLAIAHADSDLDRALHVELNGRCLYIDDAFWENDQLVNLLFAKLEELRDVLVKLVAAELDRPVSPPAPPDLRSLEEILRGI